MPATLLRTFIALNYEPASDESFRAWAGPRLEALRRAEPSIRWAKPEQLHITCRFLGDTREDQVPRLLEAIENVGAGSRPFRLSFGPPGHFGGAGAPRVIWLAASPDPPGALGFQVELEDAAGSLGFSGEDRPWTPHLTIGRNPRRRRIAAWEAVAAAASDPPPPPVEVAGLALYSSTLLPRGPVHRQLGSGIFRG